MKPVLRWLGNKLTKKDASGCAKLSDLPTSRVSFELDSNITFLNHDQDTLYIAITIV